MEERKRVVPGCREHQLLKEAGALRSQGRCPIASKETRDEAREVSGRKEEPRRDSREEKFGGSIWKKGIGDRSGPGTKKPGL